MVQVFRAERIYLSYTFPIFVQPNGRTIEMIFDGGGGFITANHWQNSKQINAETRSNGKKLLLDFTCANEVDDADGENKRRRQQRRQSSSETKNLGLMTNEKEICLP